MAVKLGNGNWAVKEDKLLAYNDNSGLFFNKEFDFSRGSTATYVGRDGLIASAASGVPRIDFTNDTKGHLLLEPSRTNLITYSQDFSNSAWGKVSATVTANTAISPSGLQDADTVNCLSGRIQQNVSLVSGTTYIASLFAKIESGNTFSILVIGGVNPSAQFNLQTQAITNSNGGVGTMTYYGNGWYRCELKFTSATDLTTIRIVQSANGIYAWGAQIEAGSYPTSYIPTTGATATRNADLCNNSGSAQDFNSEEGVLYAEIAALADGVEGGRISVSNGTVTNYFSIDYRSTLNRLRLVYNVGGVNLVSGNKDVGTSNTNFNKIAYRYKSGEHALYINGVSVFTSTETTTYAPNTLNKIDFYTPNGASIFNGKVRNVQVFTEALTDEQLEKLTS